MPGAGCALALEWEKERDTAWAPLVISAALGSVRMDRALGLCPFLLLTLLVRAIPLCLLIWERRG